MQVLSVPPQAMPVSPLTFLILILDPLAPTKTHLWFPFSCHSPPLVSPNPEQPPLFSCLLTSLLAQTPVFSQFLDDRIVNCPYLQKHSIFQ